MKKVLKTATLCMGGDPVHVVCMGHVDAKTFNKAFKAEGWDTSNRYKNSELKYIYGYWTKGERVEGSKIKQVAPSHPKAKKMTVCNWD